MTTPTGDGTWRRRPNGSSTWSSSSLLAEQDKAAEILASRIDEDADESGRELLTQALQALVQDPLFGQVLQPTARGSKRRRRRCCCAIATIIAMQHAGPRTFPRKAVEALTALMLTATMESSSATSGRSRGRGSSTSSSVASAVGAGSFRKARASRAIGS